MSPSTTPSTNGESDRLLFRTAAALLLDELKFAKEVIRLIGAGAGTWPPAKISGLADAYLDMADERAAEGILALLEAAENREVLEAAKRHCMRYMEDSLHAYLEGLRSDNLE